MMQLYAQPPCFFASISLPMHVCYAFQKFSTKKLYDATLG